MKKSIGILALLAGLMLPMAGSAQYNTPTVGQGQLSPLESPCIPYNVGPATGTTQALIVSGTVASPGKGWVNWVKLSTGAAESYLVLRDTGALSNIQREMVDRMHYTSSHTLYGGSQSGYADRTVKFDPPALFVNGLTVTAFGCSGGCNATVCYRRQGTQTP